MAQGEIAVMDGTGDTKITWDTEKAVEVDNARAQFEALKKKGYAAYRAGRNGEPGEVMNHFDPHAGAMIMAPALVGG
jgi:hypothetical protein